MIPAQFEIVGSFYRPPAKAILNSIPVGTPLELRPEPTNDVDPNAIAVWIKTADIPAEAYKQIVFSGADSGFKIGEDPNDPEEYMKIIMFALEWHLGYIKAVVAKTMRLRGPLPGRFTIINDKCHIVLTPDVQ